jgi:predicted O-methyltransferase YrrM
MSEAADAEATIRTELRRMFADEDDVTRDARRRARAQHPPETEEAAFLGWLVGRLGPTGTPDDVVEVGAAGGVTALWIAPALTPEATLTSIEADPDAHALASEAVEVAGLGERVRSILGDPAEVLPRLTDEHYGMCLLQGAPGRYASMLPDALRLLAPGGLLVVRGVLRRGEMGTNLARFLELVRTTPELDAVVLPEHSGMLLATRR